MTKTVFVEAVHGDGGVVTSVRAQLPKAGGEVGYISSRTARRVERDIHMMTGDYLRIASVGNPPRDGFELYVRRPDGSVEGIIR